LRPAIADLKVGATIVPAGAAESAAAWGLGQRELYFTAVPSAARAGEGFPRERDGVRTVLPGLTLWAAVYRPWRG